MNRRDFLKKLGLAAAGLALARSDSAMSEGAKRRPNVVVFYTDDQGTLDVNCFGSKDLYTPNMNALAQEGVRFTQGYAHTVCCPSRALLLTGRHPQRSGVNSWTQGNPRTPKGNNMALEEVTLAEALKATGYKTALFGKWHLGAHSDHIPTKQGFDEHFGIRGGFIDNLNHHYLHGEGFHDLYRNDDEVHENGTYFPDMVTREATRFLHENKDKPFLLYVAFNIPHYPEQADKKFDDRYADMPMPRRSYAKIISTTDDRIGQILKKLDQLNLRNNTIILFTSDNGHSSEDYQIKIDDHTSGFPKGHNYGANAGGGNTGKWRGAKGCFFEGGIRVPMILSYPKRLPKNIVRNQPITLADFYPTILDLCNIDLPDCKLDGQSLLKIIASGDQPSHHKVMHWQWQKMWAVRQGNWKLIVNGRDTTDRFQGHPEPGRKIPKIFLGNLADNEPELKNHADQHPEIVRKLTKLHEKWLKDVLGD